MKQDKYLVIVGGPTAVGKTNISIELAKKLKCDIISADSRQFYREMSIGTAKPTAEELSQAKHHFIDSLSIHEDYSVGKFERDTLHLLDLLFQKNKYCILTGGSGLYLNAILNGLDKFPDIDPSFRQALNLEYEQSGLGSLINELKEKDPTYGDKVDQANPQRIIRALEVVRATGQPFSSFLRQKPVERPFHILTFQLTMDRPRLYERINKRVDIMVEMGLEEEARGLLSHKDLNALRTVGYSEWFDHFVGKTSKSEAIELIKRNTRRYAKRQITWFKNQGDYTPIPQNGKTLTTLMDLIDSK